MIQPSYFKKRAVILSIAIATALAAPAAQASQPRTRVVGCKAESCLVVSGKRADAQAEISINGHAVAVQGHRNWRVRVPIKTIRDWSAPLARSIVVAVGSGSQRREFDTRLPIGLLGQPQDLAFLEISLK